MRTANEVADVHFMTELAPVNDLAGAVVRFTVVDAELGESRGHGTISYRPAC